MITAGIVCIAAYIVANAMLYLTVHFAVWKATHPRLRK